MAEVKDTRKPPLARTWIVLNCEGDVAFGPYVWVRLEPGEGSAPVSIRVSDRDDARREKVFAEFVGGYWTVRDEGYPTHQGRDWRDPRFTHQYGWPGAKRARRGPGRRKSQQDHPGIESI